MEVKLIYLPKFHCELNPFGMFWAQLKNECRKNNDQTSNCDLLKENIMNSKKKYIF